MSKQGNSNLLNYSFLLLILTIGLPIAIAQVDENPLIILNGSDPQHVKLGDGYQEQGALGLDLIDGEITDSIVIDTSEFVDAVGTYTIYYDVTDSDTNTFQVTRTVNVKDATNTFPVITFTGSNPQQVSLGEGYSELGATASDVEDGDLTGSMTIDSTEFVDALGYYWIYYSVTDSDSNVVEEIRTVDVNPLFTPPTPPDPIFLPPPEPQELNVAVRGETTEETILSDDGVIIHGSTRMGLPTHIENNEGLFVADIFNEDGDGIQIESGYGSYYFGKDSCALSEYSVGRIVADPVIKGNMWVVKQALNGTDSWSDVSQNSLDCVVTTTVTDDVITINSTKSDVNGTITEIYEYTQYKGMKQTVYFTNNDPTLTNEKFSFSNIMQDTPKSFRTAQVETVNGTQVVTSQAFSIYSTANQPLSLGGNTAVINSTVGTIVEYDREDFVINGTEVIQGFTWHLNDGKIAQYTFDTAITELWKLKFEYKSNSDFDVYVDYANVNATLPVGSTTSIDPTTTITNFDLLTVKAFPSFANGGTCGQGYATAIFTGLAQGQAGGAGGVFGCELPILKFDITAIPDDALPISGTFTMEILTQGGTGVHQRPAYFRAILDEDMFVLSPAVVAPAVIGSGETVAVSHFLLSGVGGTTINGASCSAIFPCFMTDTKSAPLDPFLVEFEQQLESGKNFYQLAWCMANTGACGNVVTNGSFVVATFTFDPAGTQLEVEWILLAPAQPPQNEFAFYTAFPDECNIDWDAPSDIGGAPSIDGYQLLRNSGGADQVIVADTGSALPTDYVDSTILAGVGYTYKIAAITTQGVGLFTNGTNTCGVPTDPSAPFLQPAQNIALNQVALDWLPPVFTGNDAIVGYKIERTGGTPATENDGWNFIQHKRQGNEVTCCHSGEILNVDDAQGQEWRSPTGCPSCSRFTNSIVEGFSFGTWHSHTGIGHAYIFKSFDKEDLINRDIEIKWAQHKIAAGYSLQTFGDWETRIMLVDGVYDMTDANIPSGSGSFPQGVAGTGQGDNVGLHLPAIGNGAIVDCLDTVNNTTILVGGNPVVATLPSTSQMQSAGHHTIVCNAGDLSGASQDQVTLLFQLYDNQNASIPCGSNCASSGAGSIVLDRIEIDGLGFWNWQNDLPLETIVTFDSVSETQSIFGSMQVLDFILGDGFLTLVEDTANTLTEFIDTTVAQLTQYGYRVSAINSISTSVPSNIVAILTAGLPDTMNAPTVTATGTQTISITWVQPQLNQGALLGYELQRKVTQGGIFSTLESGILETSFDDGEGLFTLAPATEYCYRVNVETTVGVGIFSDEACASTFDAPSVVTNLVVTALDGSSVDMSFDDPVSDGGSDLLGFKIERAIGAGAFITLDELTLIKFRNDTALPVGTEIFYRVQASNLFGFGQSVTASDTTDSTPQVPQNFACSASSTTSLTLSWDTPITFSAPTGYQVDRREILGSFSTIVANTASTDTTFLDDSLPTDSTFEYRILAITTEGNTDFTEVITCSVLGKPDFPPEDLQGQFTTTVPHQMVLAWDIPDTFGIPINSFRVERDDGAGYNEIATVSGSTFVFIDDSPDNSISQKYRVFTVGSEGDSPPTVAVPFIANQTSHWAYEKSIDDTGKNKNTGLITGNAIFDSGVNGLGHDFDGSTYITVSDEDYDYPNTQSFGITTQYKGSSTGVVQGLVTKANTFGSIGYSMFIDSTDVLGVRITNTAGSNELHVLGSTPVTDNVFHFLGFGYTVSENGSLAELYEFFVNCLDNQCGGLWTSVPDTDRVFVNTADDQIDFIFQSNIDDDIIYYDLGSPVGSKYEIQFKIYFDDVNTGGSSEYLAFGITDSTSPPKTADHDSINYVLQQGVGTDHMAVDYIDNNVIDQSGSCDSDPYSFLPATNYYFELEVDGTALRGNFYLDNFSDQGGTLTHTQSCTIVGTIDGLQYVYLSSVSAVQTNSIAGEALRINAYDGLFAQDQTLSLNVDGSFETLNIVTDNLSSTILNNNDLTIGAYDNASNDLTAILDDTRIFGGGTLNDETLQAVADESIDTLIPINATIVLNGNVFADISAETPLVIMTSGYPLPNVDTLDLLNFTATNVNTNTPAIIIDGVSGVFALNDPSFFNVMSSLSNYTVTGSLTNSQETVNLLSNFDIQVPIFTFSGDFFFQQQRDETFEILSFNYTQTVIPFDLVCNFKSTLFDEGVTVPFNDVFFVQTFQPVPRLEDVVVACIDPNIPPTDPTAPSFGGSNQLLSFVSFGDTTGIGNFLQFTNNFGDFFGVGLPFLFVIILAAAFTGRSAPTGILIIGLALGIMWFLGILVIDPFMWGIILVLIILGVLGGKKFL